MPSFHSSYHSSPSFEPIYEAEENDLAALLDDADVACNSLSNGDTYFMYAISVPAAERTELIDELLCVGMENGAYTVPNCENGEYPLHVAVRVGDAEMFWKILVAYPESLLFTDYGEKTPMSLLYAQQYSREFSPNYPMYEMCAAVVELAPHMFTEPIIKGARVSTWLHRVLYAFPFSYKLHDLMLSATPDWFIGITDDQGNTPLQYAVASLLWAIGDDTKLACFPRVVHMAKLYPAALSADVYKAHITGEVGHTLHYLFGWLGWADNRKGRQAEDSLCTLIRLNQDAVAKVSTIGASRNNSILQIACAKQMGYRVLAELMRAAPQHAALCWGYFNNPFGCYSKSALKDAVDALSAKARTPAMIAWAMLPRRNRFKKSVVEANA